MKIYSLKNKEALDQINKVTLNFETRLQDACRHDLEEDGVEVSIYIRRDDLEITEAYAPNEWNEYPSITPPGNTLMRCVRKTDNGKLVRYCAQYVMSGKECKWVDEFGNKVRDPMIFRPWDEE